MYTLKKRQGNVVKGLIIMFWLLFCPQLVDQKMQNTRKVDLLFFAVVFLKKKILELVKQGRDEKDKIINFVCPVPVGFGALGSLSWMLRSGRWTCSSSWCTTQTHSQHYLTAIKELFLRRGGRRREKTDEPSQCLCWTGCRYERLISHKLLCSSDNPL